MANRPASQSSQAGPSSSGNVPARSTASGSSSRRDLISMLDDIDRPAPTPKAAASSRPVSSQASSPFRPNPALVGPRANQPQPNSRVSHSASNRPIRPNALDSLNVNAPTVRRSSMTRDVKPGLLSAPSRMPSFHMSDSDDDDDDDDIQELVGSRVPPGMRKGREAPVVVRDTAPRTSGRPMSRQSTSSSSSSVQEVKPKIEQSQRPIRPAMPTLGSSLSSRHDTKLNLPHSLSRDGRSTPSAVIRECRSRSSSAS